MVKKLLFISSFLIATIAFSQEKSVDAFSASPNPFTDKTTITFKSLNQQPVIFSVRNVLGKTVYSEQISANKGTNKLLFVRNNLRSGMYIYTLQSNKEIVSKRFVIK